MDMELEAIQEIIGSEPGKKLYDFINFSINPPQAVNPANADIVQIL